MLERLARDKHTSLLQKFVNDGRKKFCNIGSRSKSLEEVQFVEVPQKVEAVDKLDRFDTIS
jgi:hypothetical protein